MLQTVDIGERALEDYRGVAADSLLEELRARAEPLHGARVLHVNATSYGGGVSELLRSTVPLLNDLGIVADWKVIRGDDRFFAATKALHNALQGNPQELTVDQRAAFLASSQENARALQESYDFVFVHDPQPAALPALAGRGSARWIWRCHIDTSRPQPAAWAFLAQFLDCYDAAVFTMAGFMPPDLPVSKRALIPPAIDPLSPKNMPLPDASARDVLGWLGLRSRGPLITQVSRFDPWKDPLGVIEAYRLAREQVPGLRLALVGSMALDDPEGWEIYEQVQAASRTDPRIHVFTNLTGVGNVEVNAFQRLSEVIVQKSTREGFGLVISEALWKDTPVVAGRAGGIALQMADGVGGRLVEDTDQCAAALVELLTDPDLSRELAASGRQRVREHFLLPRLLLNEISLMSELGRERPLTDQLADGPAARDPVCGMAIAAGSDALRAEQKGATYRFCSEDCRARFLDDPDRFLTRLHG
jgi:trehalose synthase